jgi:hypothetical protein
MADHYEAEVNLGSINVGHFTRQLNDRWERGWRLARIFEQAGNTIVIWERRDPREERRGGREGRQRLGGMRQRLGGQTRDRLRGRLGRPPGG